MGSLQLECPLCCNETFPCHNSLKYHLLSIIDNLICPLCNGRFEKVIDLIIHLDSQCTDTNSSQVVDNSTKVRADLVGENNTEPLLSSSRVLIKEEMLDEETQPSSLTTSSILAKVLLKDSTPHNLELPNNEVLKSLLQDNEEHKNEDVEKESNKDDLYHCSSCNVNFKSVEEHVSEFHEGNLVYFNDDEPGEDCNEKEQCMSEEENKDNNDPKIVQKSPDFLNTVQEEECVDKDGRKYIRRVVKIEKFWENETPPDIITDNTSNETMNNYLIATDTGTSQTVVYNVLEIYQCWKCKEQFSTLNYYSQHDCDDMLVDNSSNKYKKCKYCNACFVNTKFLAIHNMKMHTPKITTADLEAQNKPPFICEICNTEFSTYKSLKLHKRMHEPIKSKGVDPPVNYGMLGEALVPNSFNEMFICQICNKTYNKKYEEAHKKYHNKEMNYICEVCNRKFNTQDNLDMHMHAHTDSKKFICSYCKKGFLTNEKLEDHISTKCQKRQYECQYCGRRFTRPHEKVKHERIHTGEKPHVCEICGKSFRVSYCLTLHMRTHSGTRPYKCEHCGKRFKAHSVYSHHILTHSDDRKYKCSYCPKTFKTSVQLAGHKNCHTKPFTCTECNRPFASLYAVRLHMETHQRQNNLKYKCDICGASYARPFALRDHIKEQHPEENESNIDNETLIFEAADNYSIVDNVDSNLTMLTAENESLLINIAVENTELGDVEMQDDISGT